MLGSRPLTARRATTIARRALSAAAFLGSRSWASSATYLRRFFFWSPSGPEDWRRFPARTAARSEAPYRYPEEAVSALSGIPRDFEALLERHGTTAFIVIKDGTIVRETYLNGHRRDSMTRAFSVSKSFAAALVGVALAEGRIGSLDDPFVRYLPELRRRPYDGITIRHLLMMTAGFRFSYGRSPAADSPLLYWHPDIRRLILDGPPLVSRPGERFHYTSYSSLALGMVLERVAGTTITDYFERSLWNRIGAEYDSTWSLDHEGSGLEYTASGFNARAIDLVKLGTLYLNRGRWGDQQVLPEAWTAESVAPPPASREASNRAGHENRYYKFGWWGQLVDGRSSPFYAEGYLDQIIYVYPDKQLVIARFGGPPYSPEGVDWPALLRDLAENIS